MNKKNISIIGEIFIQNFTQQKQIPQKQQFKTWVKAALKANIKKVEITIRIVSKNESAQLNQKYRNKAGPTNVLSFNYPVLNEIDTVLGDLIICAHLVKKEAKAEGKTLLAHWAHLVVHGVLHLQGYDHIELSEALSMERREIRVLKNLGFNNPYSKGRYEILG
ncbi:MAG: rRNA maturation RNase YbeY [Proteobacteria bacterium]|nr:rRNA maturation RNase YbeY [Pseudomonadota bacterium]